jgi:hypothetical protein
MSRTVNIDRDQARLWFNMEKNFSFSDEWCKVRKNVKWS